MKNRFRCSMTTLIVALGFIFSLTSCEYETYVDAKYPAQKIYMPAAKQNIYNINSVPVAIGSVPTPGYPFRFVTDTIARDFKVLLGVYRSGINNDGPVIVNISVNTDTIAVLKANGKIPATAVPLTAENYTMASEVSIADGEELAKFELAVDMDLLRNNMDKKYVVAVKVTSPDRAVSTGLGTTIILIDAAIMKPTANFTSVPDANPKIIKFTNTTKFGMRYNWNFGDGSSMNTSNEVNTAVTHTYAAAGTYTVTLTAYGVTTSSDKSVKTATITVQ
ncbi:MAG TPA: PKD domain-containing protein [Bacteroidales bacterium]|nr:PKD domain-containing protein [Bacteroidales bacterium]